MAVVLQSGPVRLGDNIEILSPEGPHTSLEPFKIQVLNDRCSNSGYVRVAILSQPL